MKAFRILTAVLLLLACFISSCSDSARNREKEESPNGNSYAERFRIEKKDEYTILTILNPWQGAVDVEYTYYLIRRGTNIPDGIDPDRVIYVPVEKIICMSTTYIPMLAQLDEADAICGISGSYLVYDTGMIKRLEKGELHDVGYEDNINKELILQLSPDLVMTYGIGSESTGYISKLRELGVKVIFNADYLEDDPLGKAEWIKLFGVLFCKEDEAAEIFEEISNNYLALKELISSNILWRPKVMLGLPWKDTWFISPGNSYISRLINDAGGDYLWADTESDVSMPYGIENVYVKAVQAQYWLNIGTASSRKEISVVDTRLEELPPFITGNLYNNKKRISETGGNDYWESGNLHPEIILRDIASILHPDLFPDDSLYYYRKVD